MSDQEVFRLFQVPLSQIHFGFRKMCWYLSNLEACGDNMEVTHISPFQCPNAPMTSIAVTFLRAASEAQVEAENISAIIVLMERLRQKIFQKEGYLLIINSNNVHK